MRRTPVEQGCIGFIVGAVLAMGLGCSSSEQGTNGASRPPPGASAKSSAETLGFVVSRWALEIPHEDPGECPQGFNPTESEHYGIDAEEIYSFISLEESARAASALPADACREGAAQPDPGFRTLDGPAVVAGFDLDGRTSSPDDGAQEVCPHADFRGPDGEEGIDNQFWRFMGCVRGQRPGGLFDRLNATNTNIREGGFALLIELRGVDDLRNDDHLDVRFLSADGPTVLDANSRVLPYVSYSLHADPRYHSASTLGRITDGVLETDPVDVRIRWKQQTMDTAYDFREMRLRASVGPDGSIEGVVGAYWPSENLFSINVDQFLGERHVGRGAAETRGFMCSGLYYALPRVADGHPDPETGLCSSVSTTLHVAAVPAFVIDEGTTPVGPPALPPPSSWTAMK